MPPFPQSQPRNAVLAIRVSSVKQGIEGDSPEAQREQGERFAASRNIHIVKTLAYLESASKAEQPMQDVIDWCKAHKNEVELVIVKSIDRFTRAGSYIYDDLKRQLEPLNIFPDRYLRGYQRPESKYTRPPRLQVQMERILTVPQDRTA